MTPEIERLARYTAAKTEADERKRLREKRNGCPSALVILVGILLLCGVAARWNWAPLGTDYLVGTSTTRLPNEIAAGTSPQGELGGTWPSPTVDDTALDDQYIEQDGSSGMTGTFDFGGSDHVELPNSATYSPGTTAGRIGLDDTITSYDGLWRYYDGATEMVIVAMPAADLTTTDNHVVAYSSGKSGFNNEAQAGGGGLSTSDETTSFTTSADTHHRVDVPSNSSVTVTMHSPSDGDQVRISVADESTGTGSFTQAPGYSVGFANLTSINSESYTATTTGKWSLWLTGETLLLEYDSTQSTWWVTDDGRIPMTAQGEKTSDTTGNDWPNTTYHEIMYDVLNWDVGGIADNADDMFDIKRSGVYSLVGSCLSVENVSDGHRTFMRAYDGTNGPRAGFIQAAGSGNKISIVGTTTITTVAGRQARMDVYQESGAAIDFQGVTTGATMQTITEQL